MATKKKEYNLLDQGKSFISEFPKAIPIEPEETAEVELKPARRRVNPGKMWRANLLLDADLQEPVMIQALRTGKNVSVFINDILREYIESHKV